MLRMFITWVVVPFYYSGISVSALKLEKNEVPNAQNLLILCCFEWLDLHICTINWPYLCDRYELQSTRCQKSTFSFVVVLIEDVLYIYFVYGMKKIWNRICAFLWWALQTLSSDSKFNVKLATESFCPGNCTSSSMTGYHIWLRCFC